MELLKARTADPGTPLARALAEASERLLGTAIDYSEDRLRQIMSPAYFVEVRRTLGGPAPEETARAVGESRRHLERDRAAWQARRDHLANAERQLDTKVRAL